MSVGQSFVAESVNGLDECAWLLVRKSKSVYRIKHISFLSFSVSYCYMLSSLSSVMFYPLTWPWWQSKKGKMKALQLQLHSGSHSCVR
jgi:hypothetical protein